MDRLFDLHLRIVVRELPCGAIRLEPLEFAWFNTEHDLGTAITALVRGIRRLLDAGELGRLREAPTDLAQEYRYAGLLNGKLKPATLHLRHTVRVTDAPCPA